MRSTGTLIYLETGDERWLDPKYSRRHSKAYLAERLRKMRKPRGSHAQRQAFEAARKRRDFVFDYLRALYSTCRKNAAKRKLDFTLTEDDLQLLYIRAAGRCEVTGVSFSIDRLQTSRAPFAPSIDRIDNAGGYTFANTRLTCQIANLAMNVWGAGVLHDFIRRAAARPPSGQPRTSSKPSAGRGRAAAESPDGTPPAQGSPADSACPAA
jgi:hypothetical protein